MQLKLWRDFSKKNNSTQIPISDPDDVFTNIRLKDNCSTLNPVLILTHGTFGANYTYAQWKGRYYFVRDIVSLNNATFEIHLTVDVLGTYRSYVGSYTAFVERCASSSYYDVMLVDPLIARSTNIYQINKKTVETTFIGDSFTYFFRTVSGKGIELYCAPWPSEFADVMFPQTGENNWQDILNDMFIASYNPAAYLLDYYKIPVSHYKLSPKTTPATINWGFHEASMMFTPHGSGSTRYRMVELVGDDAGFTLNLGNITLPSSGYSDFRKYDENWSKYYIWLPLIGLQQVPSQYADDTLELIYDIDAISGDCLARLRTTQDEGAVIGQYNANVKQQLQISTVNTDYQTFLSSAAGTFSDAITLNFGGMVNDIWNEQKAINQPVVNVVGNPSGNSYAGKIHDNVTTFAISYAAKDIPVTKAGRPCCRNIQLSSLAGTGFVKCTGSSISIPGTEQEREMINAYLNGGFYME